MIDWLPAAVTAASPFLLAVFAWITKRGLEQKTYEETALDRRLAQQRDDFNSVIAPLQASVTELRNANARLGERVDDLDNRLDLAEADKRELVYDFRRTLDHFETIYNDPGPRRGARVTELLGR